MQNFLDKIRQWSHWIVFLLLEIVSLVLLFRFNCYQGSVAFTQANGAVGRMLEWQSAVTQFVDLTDNNRRLTQENILLQHNIEMLRTELAELKHDTTMAEAVLTTQIEGMQLIPAEVVNNSITLRDNYITINRGSADGVKPEMGVLSGTGVVGIVYSTTPHYALVLPVLNSKSSISCRMRGSDYFGYMKWRGGGSLRAYIDDIPRHARIKRGDIVETSGFSSVFPAGIFMGRVLRILDSADGLSYEVEVQLSTDIARLRNVTVVAQQMQAEMDTLQYNMQK